jgi:hypothetical protein
MKYTHNKTLTNSDDDEHLSILASLLQLQEEKIKHVGLESGDLKFGRRSQSQGDDGVSCHAIWRQFCGHDSKCSTGFSAAL